MSRLEHGIPGWDGLLGLKMAPDRPLHGIIEPWSLRARSGLSYCCSAEGACSVAWPGSVSSRSWRFALVNWPRLLGAAANGSFLNTTAMVIESLGALPQGPYMSPVECPLKVFFTMSHFRACKCISVP